MVRFAITGESFAYNQIRKMLSSVVETAGLGGSMEFLKGQFDPLLTKHNNNAPS